MTPPLSDKEASALIENAARRSAFGVLSMSQESALILEVAKKIQLCFLIWRKTFGFRKRGKRRRSTAFAAEFTGKPCLNELPSQVVIDF
jgi:hypothetical protein